LRSDPGWRSCGPHRSLVPRQRLQESGGEVSSLHRFTHIVRAGPDQLTCGFLFQRMRHPADGARQGKEGRWLQIAEETEADKDSAIEHTAWGDAQRIQWPVQIAGCPAWWALPAHELGSDTAQW